MRSPVFGNEFFDQWLNQKSNEILAKVEREQISTEDMLILSLKAQVNHFHHMDIEFREEFQKIKERFALVDKRFEQVERRFDHLTRDLMWGFGLTISVVLASFAKSLI